MKFTLSVIVLLFCRHIFGQIEVSIGDTIEMTKEVRNEYINEDIEGRVIKINKVKYLIISKVKKGSNYVVLVPDKKKETGDEPVGYTEINFVGTGEVNKLYINDYLITSFGNGDLIRYKMYSTGRITITFLVNNVRSEGFIDVERNTRYYYLGGTGYPVLKNEQLSKKAFHEYTENLEAKKNFTFNVIEIEEDARNPVGKSKDSRPNERKQGTGFLINSDGYIITNFHVIEDASKVTISGINGDFSTPFEATVIAIDRRNDLALLRVDPRLATFSSPPYTLRSSKDVKKAERIYAVGYPIENSLGKEMKITDGIINSMTGFQSSISEFQISAAIQAGNSGGPLFDSDGELVGVIAAKIVSNGIDQVGYAIKSDYLLFFLDQIGKTTFNSGENQLQGKELHQQVELIADFIYIIESE